MQKRINKKANRNKMKNMEKMQKCKMEKMKKMKNKNFVKKLYPIQCRSSG